MTPEPPLVAPASPPPRSLRARLPLPVRRHPFVTAVEHDLRHRCGVEPTGPLVIGVSGGADSVALLLAAVAIRERPGPPDGGPLVPVAVHVHHHLRDASADADAAFVRDLCTRHRVECHVEHVRPSSERGNVAASARRLRYRALGQVARAAGARRVAVAHHGDDQLETILMALCRGAGPDGLAGMPWTRGLPGGPAGVALVRPLLERRRAECEAFCRAAGQIWRRDPGNADPDTARGRLRLDVIPVLEALWPDAARRASGTAEAVDAARVALAAQIEAAFGPAAARSWPRPALAALPAVVVAAGLRRAAVDAAPALIDDFGRRLLRPAADAIRSTDRRPKRFDWPGRLVLRVQARAVVLDQESKEDARD